MADVDIDPFGEHNRTESRTEEPTDNVFLFLWFLQLPQEEDQLGNQNENKKSHSEEKVKELN